MTQSNKQEETQWPLYFFTVKELKVMTRRGFCDVLNTLTFNPEDVKKEINVSELTYLRSVGKGMNEEAFYTDGKTIFRDPFPQGDYDNPSELQRLSK